MSDTPSRATHGHHGGNCTSEHNPDLTRVRCAGCGGRCTLCHLHGGLRVAEGNPHDEDGPAVERGKCPKCPPCEGCQK